MVIDASELGLGAVIYAILGVLVGVPLAGLLIAALASELGCQPRPAPLRLPPA